MALRKPLVIIGGVQQECPNADTFTVAPAMSDGDVDAGSSTVQATVTAAQLKAAVRRWNRDNRVIQFRDDFSRYLDPTSNFDHISVNSGAAAAYNNTIIEGHHGLVSLSTGTANAVGGAGTFGAHQGTYSAWVVVAKAACSYAEWDGIQMTPATLSTASQQYCLVMGMPGYIDQLTTTGFGFYYREDTNGGRWYCYTSNNSAVKSYADSGVTVAASTWYAWKIVYNGSNVTFYINGTQVAQISTNLPNNFIGPSAYILKSVGTGTAFITVLDYLSFYAEVSAR